MIFGAMEEEWDNYDELLIWLSKISTIVRVKGFDVAWDNWWKIDCRDWEPASFLLKKLIFYRTSMNFMAFIKLSLDPYLSN